MNPAPKSIGRRPPAAVPTERSGRRSSVIKFTPGAPSYVQRAPDQLVTEVEHAAGVQAAIACRVARDAETGEFRGRPLARGPHLRIVRAALVQTLDLPEAKAHARRGEGDQAAGEITPDRPPSPSTACTAHRDTSPAGARRCRCPCCAHRSSRCGSRIAPRGSPAGRRCPPEPRRRSEEHTSELQSLAYLVCRLLLEKKKRKVRHAAHTTRGQTRA